MKETKPKRGRKPIEDKKVQIPIYVKKSTIDALSGIENVRIAAYNGIEVSKRLNGKK